MYGGRRDGEKVSFQSTIACEERDEEKEPEGEKVRRRE